MSRAFSSLLLRLGFYGGQRRIASCLGQLSRYPAVFAAQEEAGGGGGGKEKVLSLLMPVEGHECSPDSGRHLKVRRKEVQAIPPRGSAPTFRVADSWLGTGWGGDELCC